MPTKQVKLLKRLEDIVRMRTILHPRLYKHEAQLMMSKWFNYRFMSPIEATALFAVEYNKSLKRHLRFYMDVEGAEKVRDISGDIPLSRNQQYTQLWCARQRTDQLLLPYDFLVDFSLSFSGRRKRYWQMRPNQLHPSPANERAWWPAFEEHVNDHAPVVASRAGQIPQLRNEHYQGLPPQVAFKQVLLTGLKNPTRPLIDEIADLVFIKRHLTLDDITPLVDPPTRTSTTKQAQSNAEREISCFGETAVESIDGADLLPSCYGIAEARAPASQPCKECPLLQKCGRFAEIACDLTKRRTGSVSPALDAQRERNRKNTANFRKKKT